MNSNSDAPAPCGNIWMPGDDTKHVSKVICDRAVNRNGTHTGKHMYHRPSDGKMMISWWGPRRAQPKKATNA